MVNVFLWLIVLIKVKISKSQYTQYSILINDFVMHIESVYEEMKRIAIIGPIVVTNSLGNTHLNVNMG